MFPAVLSAKIANGENPTSDEIIEAERVAKAALDIRNKSVHDAEKRFPEEFSRVLEAIKHSGWSNYVDVFETQKYAGRCKAPSTVQQVKQSLGYETWYHLAGLITDRLIDMGYPVEEHFDYDGDGEIGARRCLRVTVRGCELPKPQSKDHDEITVESLARAAARFPQVIEEVINQVKSAAHEKEKSCICMRERKYSGSIHNPSTDEGINHNIEHQTWNELAKLVAGHLRAQGYAVEIKAEWVNTEALKMESYLEISFAHY